MGSPVTTIQYSTAQFIQIYFSDVIVMSDSSGCNTRL